METVDKNEVRAILATPHFAEDIGDLFPTKQRPWHQEVECGLLSQDNAGLKTRSGLFIRLEYTLSATTKLRTIQCSVFRSQLGGAQRIYQLTITHSPKKIKDLHSLSHEHYGSERSEPRPEWGSWTFERVMAYFCERTNITFVPPVNNPEELRLK